VTEKSEDVKAYTSVKVESSVLTNISPPQHSRARESQGLILPQMPQIPDLPFGVGDSTQTKTWLFNEWFIPPLGSGRTIIDLFGTKLILVRTTTTGGAKVLYVAIESNIRVWNPFVSGREAVLSVTFTDVGKTYVFGSFPSGCGVTTWVVRNVNVADDIFDAANMAQLSMSAFSFFYC
jgi:hypothetical protein